MWHLQTCLFLVDPPHLSLSISLIYLFVCFYIYLLYLFRVCVHAYTWVMHVHTHTCGGQRSACRRQLSPSSFLPTLWVSWIRLRWSDLAAAASTQGTIWPALVFVCVFEVGPPYIALLTSHVWEFLCPRLWLGLQACTAIVSHILAISVWYVILGTGVS